MLYTNIVNKDLFSQHIFQKSASPFEKSASHGAHIRSVTNQLKGRVGHFRNTFCYIPWNALNIPIAMNKLNAINIYKYFICGSRGAVKSKSNYLPRPAEDNWMAYLPACQPSISCTHLSRALIGHVHVRVCWRRGSIRKSEGRGRFFSIVYFHILVYSSWFVHSYLPYPRAV